ncbi:MAG: biosynthesis protein CapA [Candidatus Parcubacteria bacterium]|jgi:poly-gamma-glutamate synthesis protein (capsule biosynthesis protein)
MKRPQLLFSLLIFILIVQVTTLNPVIAFPYNEQGTFVQNIKREGVQLKKRVEQTLFSVKETKVYNSVVFTGDVMLGRNVEVLMRQQSMSYPYLGMNLQSLAPNAAIVGNFESSMAEPHVMTPALQMKFSVDEMFLPALKEAGYTHLSQANNHSFDYGESGFLHTTALLEQNHITPFGHGYQFSKNSITYLESSSGRVALVGINASASIPEKREVVSLLDEAAKNSALQVVYIHWGTEYEPIHSRAQELLAKELVVAGADLIVGHHPHVVQDIGLIDGVLVFYSLGNYIFDQYFSDEVQEGLVLTLALEDYPFLALIPVESKTVKSQPAPMNPSQHQAFLQSLAERSAPELSNDILHGIIPLKAEVATSTKMAMIDR